MSGARTGLLVSASAGAPCSRRLSPLRLRSSTPGPTPSPRAVAVETSDTLVGCSGGISVRARLADAMTGLRGLLDASNALVRRHLDADEQVMAIGRCDEVTGRGDPDPYAGGWTFIMVTTRKLRWVPRANPRFEASLDFDDVMAISESLHGHRYRIGLRHVPIPPSPTRPRSPVRDVRLGQPHRGAGGDPDRPRVQPPRHRSGIGSPPSTESPRSELAFSSLR